MKKFLFNYRYEGADYGLDVVADNVEEAKGRVRAMSLARYDGEIFVTVPVPAGGLIVRLIDWFRRSKG